MGGLMKGVREIGFQELASADLFVDGIYKGGQKGHAGDDPLPYLLKVSNQGGFRYRGRVDRLELVVLTTTLSDPDWPDNLDVETGVFTYFGDNKKPGRNLHDTPRNGNEILRRLFDLAHSGRAERLQVPPVFVFANAGRARDLTFLGLAVPGSGDLRLSEDLVAIWKTSRALRFQNYRARFTILDVSMIPRLWIEDIWKGCPLSSNAPSAWRDWVETGRSRPLRAIQSIEYRTKAEQLPKDPVGENIIRTIHTYFKTDSYSFEKCAAAIARFMLPDVASMDLTRPFRDGGRDAVGKLRIGVGGSSILVDFALEAKCYGVSSATGVREMSRLISRLRHRQFGILVTTSYLDLQAYKEIKEDQHPVIVIAAADIVELLRSNGLADVASVEGWLAHEFPRE
jgi:hypothetical protein